MCLMIRLNTLLKEGYVDVIERSKHISIIRATIVLIRRDSLRYVVHKDY